MIRSAVILFAVTLVSAPAIAANYSATLATPTSGRIIASDISWHCGGAACQGSTEESRPLVLCESLVRRAGRVESFLVDGRAFTPAEIERCNASIKDKAAEVAAQ